MPEIVEINRVTDIQLAKLEDCIDELRDNLLIMTSRESGISRREKILKISPLDTDSLEERRFRILLNWYDSYPYTEKDILQRLNRLCGAGEYIFDLDKTQNNLECRLELTSKKKRDALELLLNEILSLNIALTVGLRYNQHVKLARFTHGQLSAYTHQALREEVLPNE
ncbi:YmfQ family protein [Anaerovorax odorimutans]|uniref:YmfQ family protein n=2 Tax=Anaerovorax odorimutans TaxID=109327 RepID=A0ABT1RR38_9FIRM|nr:YmfQ family protein [Anaerovorax odorimutans]